jgi:hypothetical protein
MRRARSITIAAATALALLFLAVLAWPAHAIIPRTTGAWLFGPMPVWTNGTTSTPGLFHPMSKAIDAKGLISARVSTEMSEDSGNCKMRPALQYSNDGISWDTHKEIVTTFVTTNTIDYGTSYVDLTALAATTPRA